MRKILTKTLRGAAAGMVAATVFLLSDTVTLGPVEPEDQNASNIVKARQMMTAVNRHFEDWIRENPGQWYCGNRRWPKRISNAEDVKSIASGAGADTKQDESGDRAA